MDIFTHMLIGAAATSPFWTTHPLESVAFVFGSIIPDVDALSRQFGKVAYLRAHQTWTHAIPLQLLGTALLAGGIWVADLQILLPSVFAFGAGAVLHSLLDWTNTYGVRLFAPFDRRRRSLEWVFFIDAVVIALCITAVMVQIALIQSGLAPRVEIAVAWGLLTVGYFAVKATLRARADELESSDSLIPSALVPWRFYGFRRAGDTAETYTVNLVSGVDDRQIHRVHDDARLDRCAEYRAMRELSEGFVVVRHDGERIVCRDLRTRNFGTDFGRLQIELVGGEPVVEAFDV